jgi:CubicO group peptidase (beta-lactamase class C family)
MDKRQVKLGVLGFLFVLLTSMLSLKPYLPSALYHGLPGQKDYTFFSNRPVKAKTTGTAWVTSSHILQNPPADLQTLLTDLKTTALLVIENGKIVYEHYDQGGGAEVISPSFSMSKSILSLLFGFALEDGRIKSLDEPISRYLPEWEDRDEGKITLRQLLTMTSGLNWKENFVSPFSILAEGYYGRDLHTTALRQRLVDEPGKVFSYQSGSVQLLGLALSRATNMSLSEYLSRKLWIPLGAEKDALWSLDHEEGMEKAFCCLNATARDFARIGELMRLKGQWQGQTLLSNRYLSLITTPTGHFGYDWWIYESAEGQVPFAWGFLGQYILVVPQKNRVVVRLGKNSGKISDGFPEELTKLVDWALSAP